MKNKKTKNKPKYLDSDPKDNTMCQQKLNVCLKGKPYIGQVIFIVKQYGIKTIPHINVCFYSCERELIDDFCAVH